MAPAPYLNFRSIFEMLPGNLVVLTPAFEVAAVNDAVLHSTHTSREKIVGMNIFDAFPDNPDDPLADGIERLRASFERVLAHGRPDQIEFQRYAVQGPRGGFEQRFWKVHNSPVFGPEGTVEYIINQAEDLTHYHDLKQRQKALEEELLATHRVTHTATFDWDLKTSNVAWSANSDMIFHLASGQINRYPEWMDWIHPDDRTRAERAIQDAMTSCELADEWRILQLDGSLRWTSVRGTVMKDEAGSPLRMSGTFMDITDRKAAERHRAELAAIVESSDDAMVSKSPTGTILSWNPGAEKMFGYQAREVIGKNVKILIPPDRMEEEAEIRHRLNQGTGQAIHQETVRLSKDGKRIDVALTLSPVRDASGAIVASSMVCRDITQRKADDLQLKLLHNTLEQRVNERTLQLDRANKELQSFSYSVSHDLRAPLRGIDGWSAALMEDFGEKLDETGMEYLGRVRSETQRMGQLIDDLLRLAMISQAGIVVKEVDLSKCVRSAADRLRETAPDRAVDFNIEPGLVVQGDAGLLDVALTNLIENAWKYTSKLPAARIDFGVMKINGELTYFVRDNGDGFDMKYATKLFAPFHRMHTPRDFPGTGVGLATVQRIIHRHGGRIWAEAKPKVGATFCFTLGNPESIR